MTFTLYPCPNIKTTIRKQNGEYVVRLHVNGVHQVDANYYTDDKVDAIDTATAMMRDAARIEEANKPQYQI